MFAPPPPSSTGTFGMTTATNTWESVRLDASGPFDRRPTRGWFPSSSSSSALRLAMWPPPPAKFMAPSPTSALTPNTTATATTTKPTFAPSWRPPVYHAVPAFSDANTSTPVFGVPSKPFGGANAGFDFSGLRANATAAPSMNASLSSATADSFSPAAPVGSGAFGGGFGSAQALVETVNAEAEPVQETPQRIAAVDDQPFAGDAQLERTVQEVLADTSLLSAVADGDNTETQRPLSPAKASAGGSRSAAFVRRTPAPRLGRHRGPMVVEMQPDDVGEQAEASPPNSHLDDYDL